MTNESAIQVIIVDDDHAVRFFLQEALERDGYEVTAVENGEEALNLCQKKNVCPGLTRPETEGNGWHSGFA
jgi:CheY-like chemotaxis protein